MVVIQEMWRAIRATASLAAQGRFWLMLLSQLRAPSVLLALLSIGVANYVAPPYLRDGSYFYAMVFAEPGTISATVALMVLLSVVSSAYAVLIAAPTLLRACGPVIARAVQRQLMLDFPEAELPSARRFFISWLGLLVVLLALYLGKLGLDRYLLSDSPATGYLFYFLVDVVVSTYQVRLALCLYAGAADLAAVKRSTLLRRAMLWTLLVNLVMRASWYVAIAGHVGDDAPAAISAAASVADVLIRCAVMIVVQLLWASLSLQALAAHRAVPLPAVAWISSKVWLVVLVLVAALPLAYTPRMHLLHAYLSMTHERYRYIVEEVDSKPHAEQLRFALYAMVFHGDNATARLMVRAGVPGVDGRKYDHELNCAVSLADGQMVEFLLAHGANVNSQADLPESGQYAQLTPLQYALHREDAVMAALLLRHGADPNWRAERVAGGLHGTPLQFAAASGNIALVRLLLKSGARAGAADSLIQHYVRGVIRQSDQEAPDWKATLEEASAAGIDITQRDQQGRSVLHYAAATGELELIAALIARGVDPLATDHEGVLPYTELARWSAAKRSSPELTRLLGVLSKGTPDHGGAGVATAAP